MIKNIHPFKSYHPEEFKILSVKKCSQKYLFHSSGKKLINLDPKYNTVKKAFGNVHEYGVPVVFAKKTPSDAFCYKETKKYLQTKKEVGDSCYHRLFYKEHKILLGAKMSGYVYVLSGADFYEVKRKDFENSKWVTSTEYISPSKLKPLDKIKISQPYEWEMLPEYEFLGKKYVGFIPAQVYLKLCKSQKIKNKILELISKPFIKTTPKKLKKYL